MSYRTVSMMNIVQVDGFWSVLELGLFQDFNSLTCSGC